MRRVFILVILFICATTTNAQTYIKTNALYWAVLLPNIQVETKIAKQFTFQGEINASLWTINETPMIGMQNIAGIRWYPKEAFKGFYFGGDVAFDCYKVSKWNYWGITDNVIYIQNGVGLYLGFTLGYQLELAKRWNMDFFLGGGWHHGWYWGVKKYPNGNHQMYVDWNKSGEWIPYKIGVTFAYRLTNKKRMVAKYGKDY